MITLTTEQAQQIEEAFDKARIGLRDWELPENRYAALNAINPALSTIRAARAQKQEPMFFVLTQDNTWLSISEGKYEKVAPEGRMKAYAAPVRTKDLTDGDLCKIGEEHALGMECEGYENNMLWYEVNPLPAFRAVIAADREKNK